MCVGGGGRRGSVKLVKQKRGGVGSNQSIVMGGWFVRWVQHGGSRGHVLSEAQSHDQLHADEWECDTVCERCPR